MNICSTCEKLQARSERLVAKYNNEYNAGLWHTNRTLAGKAENAYSALIDHKMAHEAQE